MRIILFRHGPAGRRDASLWPDDALRPLTRRGEERTRQAAHGLGRIEPDVSLILTSPFRRTDAGAVVLVGHEPDLGQLAAMLIGSIPLPLKKAGACAIAFDDRVAPGAGSLCWLATRKLLRRLAPKKDKV